MRAVQLRRLDQKPCAQRKGALHNTASSAFAGAIYVRHKTSHLKVTIMSVSEKSRGFFRRSYDAFITAREQEAHRIVSGLLLDLNDDELRKRGFSRAELRRSGR